MVTLVYVVCMLLPAKPSVKRSAPPPVTDVRRPSAPVFLRGLQDLRVMDGSQVTMTVEVTGMKGQHEISFSSRRRAE